MDLEVPTSSTPPAGGEGEQPQGIRARLKRKLGIDKPPAIQTAQDQRQMEVEAETKEVKAKEPKKPGEPQDLVEVAPYARTRAVAGEKRGPEGKRIMGPETVIEFGPELEYELYRKINELMSIIGNEADLNAVSRDKELSRYAYIIRELYRDRWQPNATGGLWEKLSEGIKPQEKKKILEQLRQGNHHIFPTLDEAIAAYGFLEQSEKIIVTQLGYDMTNGGTRHLVLDLSDQNINVLLREKIPPQWQQAVQQLASAIRLGNWDRVAVALNSLGAGGVAYLASQNILHFESPEKFIAGGAATVGTVATAALIRGIGNWVGRFPEAQAEGQASMILSFRPTAEGRLEDQINNPIAQHFVGRGEDAQAFLKESDQVRVEMARRLGIDEDWQIDLGSENLGLLEARGGIDFRLRLLAVKYLKIILETKFRNPDGTVKRLTDLSASEQRDVFSEALNGAMMDYGEAYLRSVAQKIALREAKGEEAGKRDARQGELDNLADKMENGEVVQHHKEGATTLEEAEAAMIDAQRRRDRLDTSKTDYGTKHDELMTAQGELETMAIELETLQEINGHDTFEEKNDQGQVISKIQAIGKIASLRLEEARNNNRIGELQELIGYNPDKRQYAPDSLHARYKKASQKVNVINKEVTSRENQRDKAQDSLTAERAKPAQDQDKGRIENLKETVRECKDKIEKLEGELTTAELELDPLKDEYKPLIEKLEVLNERQKAIPGEISQLAEAVAKKREEYNKAGLTYRLKFREIHQLLQVIGYTQEQLSNPSFVLPTTQTISDQFDDADRIFKEKKVEYEEMKKRADEGKAIAVSDEDMEIVRVLRIIAPGITDTKLNEVQEAVIDRTISLEDLAEVVGDKGVRFIYEKFFGTSVLIEGSQDYQLIRRALSKGMMADTGIRVWQLEGRIDDFLIDNPQSLVNYRLSQKNSSTIEVHWREVDTLERTKPDGWQQRVSLLRSKIARLNEQNDELLADVYDRKIAPLLKQDRVRTATFLRVLIDDLYERAKIGNPFNEVIGRQGKPLEREVQQTPDGVVTFERASFDPQTGILQNRGAVVVEEIGGLRNLRARLSIDNRRPSGALDLEVVVGKTQQVIDQLPVALPADFPLELNFFFYDDRGNKRTVGQIDSFIDGLADQAAARTAANAAGVDEALIMGVLFDADGRKRRSSEITSFAVRRDSSVITNTDTLVRELSYLRVNAQRHFQHALGRALINNNAFLNQELLTDKFSEIRYTSFAGTDRDSFVIKNETGILTAYYAVRGSPQRIELTRLVSGVELPGIGTSLMPAPDEINSILVRTARAGIVAIRSRQVIK